MFANSLKYFFRKVLIPIRVIANEILKELLCCSHKYNWYLCRFI